MPLAGTPPFVEGFDEQSLKRAMPGWMISLILHAVVFALLMFGIHRSGSPDGDPNANGTFQIIGSFDRTNLGRGGGSGLEGPDATGTDVTIGLASASEAGQEAEATPVLISKSEVPDSDSSLSRKLLSLPDTSGVGAANNLPLNTPRMTTLRPASLPTRRPGGIRASGRTGSGFGTGIGNGVGKGRGGGTGVGLGNGDGTSFFQITAQGTHFCYVVDSSSSMEGGPMGLARAELIASIERLDSAKKFQILFYNSEIRPLTKGKQDWFYATEINRLFARQFIDNQQPDSSTLHFPALAAALAYAPDVIFFLTDGDIPDLNASELKELKRRNRNNTQIHVVEFGKDAKLGPVNWLERLAKDHNGTYRYRDVTALENE